jgi:hypothetical protein
MSEHPVDDGLRDAFRRLRAETEGATRVPDFRAVLARAQATAVARPALEVVEGGGWRSRRRLVRMGGWATAALAASLAGLLLLERGPSGDDEFARLVASYSTAASGGAWQSPTSGLLAVPGMELTRSVPSIGAPLPGLDFEPPPDQVPATDPRVDA